MRTALLVLLVACSGSSPPTPTTKPAPPPSTLQPASTGALSEAEFKALHDVPATTTVPSKGQTITLAGTRAYVSLPPGNGPFPAIVVLHEWWGLNRHIELFTDRLAGIGWAAIAVDLLGTVATTRDEAMAATKAVDDEKAKQTISAGLDYLAKDPRIRATKKAVIGWCFGGGWSLKTALEHPELDAAIIFYGRLETDPAKLAAIKAKVLAGFGTRDQGIPNESVDKFEAALKEAGVTATVNRYDAEHAFANPSNTERYDQANSAKAWDHVVAFLAGIAKH